MVLTEAQNQIASDTHRYRVINCGRQFGKTTLAIEEIKGIALAKEARIVYLATTIQQARDIAWNMLRKELLGITLSARESPNLEIEVRNIKGTISVIQLKGWEAVETLRGQQFDFMVLDEVASMRNFWINWQEVLLPTLSFREGSVMFISTPKGFNHFYDLYNTELKDKDFKSFHFTSYDNPYLKKDEIENAKVKTTPDRFAQEYMGSFQKTTGLVYKEFNREKHLYDELPILAMWGMPTRSRYQKLGAIDFGYRNPAAVLTVMFDGEKLFVEDEWYKRERTDTEIAEYAARCKFKEVYPDPENQGGVEELRRKNINVKEVVKGPSSVKNGIQSVRELFLRGDLMIHKRCVNLISELEMYSYDGDKNERNEQENPLKANDHACFVAGTIVDGKKIEDIGEKTGIEDVYEYDIAGEKLTATKNHLVCTQRGLINIDTLRYDDVVWKDKSLFMRVSGGTDIHAVKVGLKEITIVVARRIVEAKIRDYIALSGKKRMELFPMDIIFIILTAIPAIIHWIILSVFSALNTLKIIGQMKSMNGLKKISNVLFNWLPIGQKPLMVNVGGRKLDLQTLTFFSIEKQSRGTVICARKSMQQKVMGEIDSVIQIAGKKHFVGRVPVYNLKTKSGMYLANGILVSNCDALRYLVSSLLPMITRQQFLDAIPVRESPEPKNPAR